MMKKCMSFKLRLVTQNNSQVMLYGNSGMSTGPGRKDYCTCGSGLSFARHSISAVVTSCAVQLLADAGTRPAVLDVILQ
jgi:hypothetical protein